jgi:hypothetical protein
VWGGDVLFVAALCLRGEVAEIPEPLFSYRLFFDKSGPDVAQVLNVPMSWIHLTLGMLKNIWRAPLSLAERIRLAGMFVIEFCVRNPVVSDYISQEGFSGVRYALAHKHFRRALAMAPLAIVLLGPAYVRRGWNWSHETRPEEQI